MPRPDPMRASGRVAALAALVVSALPAALPAAAAEVGAPAPDFAGATWLNSAPLTLAGERGRPVLVFFWTFGCRNCRAVQPYVMRWYDDYRDRGLQVVAVHAPELAYERDVESVRRYVAGQGVRYPVVIDNDFTIWRRYGNRYWPAIYLIDRGGTLRYRTFGEGRYDETRRWIERLVREDGPAG